MDGSAMKEFLAGLFATWFATKRGHAKPNAGDKKDAKDMAESTYNRFDYKLQFGADKLRDLGVR